MRRADIVECAMRWLDTPYHHQAGVRGVGVDCAYLVGMVAQETGAIPEFKVAPYSTEWHWHSREEMMLEIVESFGAVRTDTPAPGDILAFQYGRTASHLGIMVTPTTFIHAHIKVGRVVLNTLTADFSARLRQVYKFPNLED